MCLMLSWSFIMPWRPFCSLLSRLFIDSWINFWVILSISSWIFYSELIFPASFPVSSVFLLFLLPKFKFNLKLNLLFFSYLLPKNTIKITKKTYFRKILPFSSYYSSYLFSSSYSPSSSSDEEEEDVIISYLSS